MAKLNHKTFFVHGGDWGSVNTKTMAQLYPDKVRGIHVTMAVNQWKGIPLLKMLLGSYFPSLVLDNTDRDYKKIYPLSEKFSTALRESGYFHIQATKPDTVGAALMDSPVGLAAYILEKFSTATNMKNVNKTDGGLTEKFTFDELLTNVMIYWFSDNVVSGLRYYKESFLIMHGSPLEEIPVPASVPVAIADFPNEISHVPKSLAHYQFPNLVQYTDMPRGGHFSAFEEPILVSDDIKKFVKTVLELELSEKSQNKEL
ncbi:unnamed protein product [Oppiella nova]|uniref:Uncharacterized protein n=1 Tax=Oppiella nova TaxID=334625 RepID=A0A7R9ML58_9ACAR|nr:unnamed protein product [Oppiella nova]CAG2179304.1 unnamed protein product [Oppiella nova]